MEIKEKLFKRKKRKKGRKPTKTANRVLMEDLEEDSNESRGQKLLDKQ